MTALAIISTIAAAVLLVLCIFQRNEMRSIGRQLRQIKTADTNSLVHNENGTSGTLVNEVNALLTEMRRSRAEYSRKNHELEQMVTNIAHDLRTPLTSAMGYINMIRTSDMPEDEKKRELEIIEKRLDRLESLIDSFFEFSKMISRGEPPQLEDLNPCAVLEEAVVHYFDDYTARGRSISLDTPPKRMTVSSNRRLLLRIFDNLIGNALKHGCDDLFIKLTEENGLTITFRNDVYEQIDTERVFDEFYTTDISRTKGNSGLGLAIAKQFTELLGGSITADCSDKSFTVTIRF
ncbi:Signal transduction histidine kinase [Ruminococcus sp. YE71]|uniref:sensor histidine kinase n=1 Tax=unclassified Ruminococcus TaxID=2608920 RepID=UPI000882647A|nr:MULTISPECIES: HAMP domain-containing sensor histidine kinase [unclassified Ruminococcus]SDA27689.1 Signal transduction histidine kinase [Ruminococcus sp. YE78]SFW45922.1 Signal transduction histidine kinase [Ruminococcus sp. YE71]